MTEAANAAQLAALQSGLAERYRIDGELGRGGMATVYLAHDLKHDRPVALKVLHPALAATLGPDRFQREIRFAARLQHPHILTVLDSGVANGQLWFTMPYVRGETLRERIRREGKLPLDEALRITREAAQALQYAHDEGVVHRDIKPENILLSKDGSTLVADFGVARALAAGSDTDQSLTETGSAIGTPTYMSPEQATGQKGTDGRADQYSLAAVCYEMLTGEPPFTGATVAALMAARFTTPVPSARGKRTDVPASVDGALRRALALKPEDRYGTMQEWVRSLTGAASGFTPTGSRTLEAPALRRRPSPTWIVAAAVLVLGLLGALWLRGGAGRRAASPEPAAAAAPARASRLAVLPFENLGDSSSEYFADGITDEVRGKLSSVPGLQVIARSSSAQYKKTAKRPQEVGRELEVDYLLTGTVRWEKGQGGNRVRVSPELIEVGTGATKWQQPFDAALTDVFQVQGDIASRVADALNVALGSDQKKSLTARPTANLAAYDAFLKAEAASEGLASQDVLGLRRAMGLYEQAVALDSTFVEAWAHLARTGAAIYFQGHTTDLEAVRRAAERAMALAPQHPDAYLAKGDYLSNVGNDAAGGLAAYEAGLKLAPDNAELLTASALAEQSLGRWEAALGHLERARALDPRSVLTARRLATTYLWLRRHPQALAAADRTLSLAPDNLTAMEVKAQVFLAQGDLAAARGVIRDAIAGSDPATVAAFFGNYWDLYWALDEHEQDLIPRLTPSAFGEDRGAWGIVLAQVLYLRGNTAKARAYADSTRIAFEEVLRAAPEDDQHHALLGIALAIMGRKADAIREAQRAVELRGLSKDAYSGAYNQHLLARTYTLVGEYDKAIDVLEPLLKVPYFVSPAWLKVDPNFAPLRGNPRFQRLVAGQ